MTSILPELNIEELVTLNNYDKVTTENTSLLPIGRSIKFDFINKKFVVVAGQVIENTAIETLEQWINLILITYKDKYNVYKDTNFYCNIGDLIAKKPNDYRISELERRITESLLRHRYIKSITNFIITKEKRTLKVEFTVILNDNSILNINKVL
ncbi:DUF2634 domain-containing protein [Clostridium estertheticum]|uniref:DUF2634 domain-containing protein n=1 Tax=Clostridium estertheticum TaxID=238834 RepID=UPI001C6F16E3|nr:DUF2634 domain-containing protein [Clostridium estertheticum]MBW9170785.1 DUF2634 domain-containing protein [Clostridium estertheticum]WLC74376.1 DUF2634 domain-containing protein [Clostridium estertheticum]